MSERRFILRNAFVLTNVLAFIGKLTNFNEPHEVIVRPHVEKRGILANARLWALHTLAAGVTGYTPEEMHEFALCKHYGYTEKNVVDPFTGEVVTKRIPLQRSSCQNRKKFGEFMEATESWYIQEFGVFLDQQDAA